MLDITKWFGRWDAAHLLHDASISLMNETICNANVSRYGKNVEAHTSYITTYVAANYKNNHARQCMVELIFLFAI